MLVNVCYICPMERGRESEEKGRELKIYNLNYFMHKFSKIAKLPHGELML